MKAGVSLSLEDLRQASKKEKRTNPATRLVFETMNKLLLGSGSIEQFLPLLAEQIKNLTHCDYVSIITYCANVSQPIPSSGVAILHGVSTKSGEYNVALQALLMEQPDRQLPFKPVAVSPSACSELFCNNPEQFDSAILLPLIMKERLLGFCLLANHATHCDEKHMAQFAPVINSLLSAYRSVCKSKVGLKTTKTNVLNLQYLNTLIEISPIGILVVDENKRIITNNIKARQMFTTEKNSALSNSAQEDEQHACLIGKNITDFIPNFIERLTHYSAKVYQLPDSVCLEHTVFENQVALRSDGSELIVNISSFSANSGDKRYCTLQIQDISQIQAYAHEYKLATQQLNALSHLVPVGIIRVDINWNCIFANDKWYELSGLTSEECLQAQWINGFHSADVKMVLEKLRESLKNVTNFSTEVRLTSPLGLVKWAEFNTQLLFDEKGEISGFIGTFADITERLNHQEKLRFCAEYDNLTGLANRNLFQQHLQQRWKSTQHSGETITVFFVDLDGFKNVNDTLGHDAGDKLLQQVASRLLNTLHNTDIVARFGGDEFVVLLSGISDKAHTKAIATKLIKTLAAPYNIDTETAFVSASIGIAITQNPELTAPAEILKQADSALYLAKAEGKNNYQFYSDKLQKASEERIKLTNQLRTAMSENRFYLAYQPQASIESNEIIGVEALLRFKDNQEHTVSPEIFIPILEETGLIVDVGQWVIENTIMQLKNWCDQGLKLKKGFMSINISPKQLLNKSLSEHIIASCDQNQISPEYLTLELTESVIIDKPQKAEAVLKQLKTIGVQLALDDFGTGYSSLTYLQRYPFDQLKIDKSFVSALASNPNDDKITKSIVALGQSLGLTITAEGVEDSAALSRLKALGATKYQGYLLSKPLEQKYCCNMLLNQAR